MNYIEIYGIESISVTGKYIDKNGQEKYNRVYVNRSVIQLADLTPKIENIDMYNILEYSYLVRLASMIATI